MTVVGLVLAFVLGLLFLTVGALKLMVPYEQGRAKIGWIGDVPAPRYRLVGWLEVAGGVGLMFPTMVDAFHLLTPLAAAGLALLMLGAVRLHIRRREWGNAIVATVVMGACAAVAGSVRF